LLNSRARTTEATPPLAPQSSRISNEGVDAVVKKLRALRAVLHTVIPIDPRGEAQTVSGEGHVENVGVEKRKYSRGYFERVMRFSAQTSFNLLPYVCSDLQMP
jgi:hypothetical protein